MIVEGLITTLNADDSVNISPMGPIVEGDWRTLVLRPFQTSTTYQNLLRAGEGVFHVTDDVELLAQAAVGQPSPPPMFAATAVRGFVLADACRWLAFRVREINNQQERAELIADVIDRGTIRDFFGFNRAKHAVVEAAILATRTRFLPATEIFAQLDRLRTLVEKTGGAAEQRAFAFLVDYVQQTLAMESKSPTDSR